MLRRECVGEDAESADDARNTGVFIEVCWWSAAFPSVSCSGRQWERTGGGRGRGRRRKRCGQLGEEGGGQILNWIDASVDSNPTPHPQLQPVIPYQSSSCFSVPASPSAASFGFTRWLAALAQRRVHVTWPAIGNAASALRSAVSSSASLRVARDPIHLAQQIIRVKGAIHLHADGLRPNLDQITAFLCACCYLLEKKYFEHWFEIQYQIHLCGRTGRQSNR